MAQLAEPLCGGMWLELKDGVVCGPENRHGVAVRGVDPLDAVGGGQNGAGDGDLALAHLDAVAAEDHETLGGVLVRGGLGGEEGKGGDGSSGSGTMGKLTSPSVAVSTSRPPALRWRFFLLGLKDECCLTTALWVGLG